ncbi:unnamed protein product [Rotaria sp. Silwood1]|nr:unnamed protein product [Rotaria sp. Silwood1]
MILRCELANHYQSKQHQDSIVNVIQQMKLQLRDTQMTSNQMDTDSPRTTTMIDNNVAINQLEELHETISILANGSETLNEDVQRLNAEALDYQNKLQHLVENVSNVKLAVEEEHVFSEANIYLMVGHLYGKLQIFKINWVCINILSYLLEGEVK